jgi:hypothetical protein
VAGAIDQRIRRPARVVGSADRLCRPACMRHKTSHHLPSSGYAANSHRRRGGMARPGRRDNSGVPRLGRADPGPPLRRGSHR